MELRPLTQNTSNPSYNTVTAWATLVWMLLESHTISLLCAVGYISLRKFYRVVGTTSIERVGY